MDPLGTIDMSPVEYADASVAWGARLVQPARWSVSSPQSLVIEISGPIVLDVPVQVALGQAWEPAEWLEDPSQTRNAAAMLGRGALAVGVGLYPVRVRLLAGTEHPVLRAGSLRVTR